ncbi:hypothetical protein F1640_14960 [Novosphingobium sp. NBM11]|uniref:hypothetical protein n=1 Tax=Novosphingobium sp. NBM11 TaxID=2596914 RepID=UPI0018925886|nr:hypothetical protein [Novosphingobium sp. NBM11]MBF5091286.1 hypothetical protein [Novosphingobium sp. NBM11]
MAAANTVTVCSKLPWDFIAEAGGKAVVFAGAKAIDPVDGKTPFLIEGYGLTPGVDAEWFDLWQAEVTPEFGPLKNMSIFAEAPAKAADASKEIAKSVKSGLEQKTDAEVGVEPAKA